MVSETQLSLAGFAQQRPTERLFLGIFPDATTAEKISAAAQKVRLKNNVRSNTLETQRFHVTLFHLGDHDTVREDIVDAVKEAMRKFEVRAFEVRFDHVASFQTRARKQPWVLLGPQRDSQLHTLHADLGKRLKLAGLGAYVSANFTPHVTLLYDHAALEKTPVEPISWMVRDVVLVRSELGKTKHHHLKRWPLR